jgi:FlaA1/EpsC-like NDP-sugar epimerase
VWEADYVTERDRARLRTIALALCETMSFTFAVAFAALVRLGVDATNDIVLYEGGVIKALLVVGITQTSMHRAHLYDPQVVAEGRELFTGLIQALAATSFVLAVIYFWLPFLMIGRGVVLLTTVLILMQAVAWRVAFEWVRSRFDQTAQTEGEPIR